MFWVIQRNLYKESAFEALLEQLARQSVEHAVVDVVPFSDIMIPEIDPLGDVFCCGASSMERVAKRKGWAPGYFGDNLDYRLWLEHYREHLVNHDALIAPLSALEPKWSQFFIRPVADSKKFTGTIMEWGEFAAWRAKLAGLEQEGEYVALGSDDLVVVAPLKKILAEYRFYVVDGEVVTGSLYKLGTQVIASSLINETVWDYARQVVKIWQPNRAFALDIWETEDGLRIGEINAINSAGFYACDIGKFIFAINEMRF